MNIIELIFWSSFGTLFVFYVSYYILMFYSARKPNNIKKRSITPSITLIIPTFNEEKVILQKLNNLKELNYPKGLIETIVIDSASTDDTCRLVQGFIEKSKSEANISLVLQESRKGKASAVNEVLGLCNGDIIVLSDADSLFEKEALRQVVSNFADPSVGAVTGRQMLLNAKQSAATGIERSYRDLFEIARIGESRLDSTPIFHGELTAFRRNLIEKISNDSVADDTELAIKVREKNYRAIYEPDAKFYEYAPPTFRARIKQKQRRGLGLIQQFIRFRHLMFNRAYGKYGLLILPSEFFMHILSPFLFATLAIFFILLIMTNPFYISIVTLFLIAVLIVVSGLLVSSKLVSPTRKIPNPLSVMLAFLHSQFCLLVSFLGMLTKNESHQWEKIEDIRTLWKT